MILALLLLLTRFEAVEPHMGTLVRVVVYADSAEQAHPAMRAAFARVREIDERLSDYRDDSEVSKLCRAPAGTPVRVSKDLSTVLASSLEWWSRSGGAFDVTAGRLVRAKGRSGEIRFDARENTVILPENVRLDFGGIAKGYAADEMLAVLRAHGLTRALVAAGGDIVAGDAPPGKKGWRVGAGSSDRVVILENRAVSTSGDSGQFLVEGVEKMSHIVDARTGEPSAFGRQITVVAPRGIDADACATTLKILGPKGLPNLPAGYEVIVTDAPTAY